MKVLIQNLLNSQTGKKMISNLSVSKDIDKSKLSEFNWVSELPLKQQELFDVISGCFNITRIDLALQLINNKIDWKFLKG